MSASNRGKFAIRCTHGKYNGYFVALPGGDRSYTTDLKAARKFMSRCEAEKQKCQEGEEVVDLMADILGIW